MPWTKKQQHVAQAVAHGWKPKGSAKGFTRSFATEVVEESKTMPTRAALTDDRKKQMRKHLKVQSTR